MILYSNYIYFLVYFVEKLKRLNYYQTLTEKYTNIYKSKFFQISRYMPTYINSLNFPLQITVLLSFLKTFIPLLISYTLTSLFFLYIVSSSMSGPYTTSSLQSIVIKINLKSFLSLPSLSNFDHVCHHLSPLSPYINLILPFKSI